tara:strand:+ start:13017 stop:13262 length:246 start_codon:yes stop_codon:yes gene_type:complete
MNNSRRKRLKTISKGLMLLKQAVSTHCAAEQEYFESMPENLQESSARGTDSQDAITDMVAASDAITDAAEYLDSAVRGASR